ncbi:MAG: transglycosylase domain-containing protein [Oscillospiraceae bacterium]|nr:transglycosylase domain-containing protein [Oscillospiraceae bacterium]
MDQTYNRSPDGRPPDRGEQPARQKKKKVSVGRIIGKTIGWIFLTVFTLGVIGVLTMGIFAKIFLTYVDTTLRPSLGEVVSEEMSLALTSTMYDKNGNVMLTLYDNGEETGGGNRELIEYSDLPKHLIDALVAIEDKRFWEHNGVDWWGTARATIYSVTGSKTQGGSTITQQLLRAKYQDTDVTVKRKFREILRALEYEKYTSKEDIITEYLNRVYFGSGYSGIQTAAKGYFGKDVSELDLAESACIIGITNNPSRYDPFRKAEWKQEDGTVKTPRDFNKSRQVDILNEMLSQGYITEAEYNAAKAEKLLFTDTDEYKAIHGLEIPEPDEEDGEEAPDTTTYNTWFEDAVINEAIDLLVEAKGIPAEDAAKLLYRAGYHIETTFDPEVQAKVDAVYKDVSNFEEYTSKSGTPIASAITIVDYNGNVVAMAGGVGEKTMNRELNLATSRRQPGSAIKPVSVYAPAIEYNVVSPGSIIDDYPINTTLRDNGYPRNSTVGSNTAGGYSGNRTVSYSVIRSLNTVSVRTLQKLTYARSFEFMENNLGFDLDPADIDLAPLAMGGLHYGVTTVEMAAAYAAFGNEGIYTKPRLVTKIWNNDRTEVVVDNDDPATRSWEAMDDTTAYLITNMLKKVMTEGTGTKARFDGMTMAGKTGTTSNNFTRYFAGYTPYYSAAVWMGYRDKDEVINASGNPAALIWKKVMESVHEGLEDKSFPAKPDGIIWVDVCADCGMKPSSLCSQDYRGSRVISVEIQAEAAPTATCTCHTEVQVCTDPETGEAYLAGDYCPEETVSTRVMLVGREHLERPDGSIVLAGDSDAHLTWFSTKGVCPIHDEFYVPLPGLPGEEGEPLPGDPGYQWPIGPWDPDSVLPGGNDTTPPGWIDTQPQPDPQPDPQPVEPDGPVEPTADPEGPPVPDPDNPVLPEEPVLP